VCVELCVCESCDDGAFATAGAAEEGECVVCCGAICCVRTVDAVCGHTHTHKTTLGSAFHCFFYEIKTTHKKNSQQLTHTHTHTHINNK